MVRSTLLIAGLLWGATASAQDWRTHTLWNWVTGSGIPKLEQLEADNAVLEARVAALEGADGGVAAAQVATALDLLPEFQEAVARSFRERGEPPENRSAAGLSSSAFDTQTNFISAVDIDNGVIIFTFGNSADEAIDGLQLPFTPYESRDLTIVWRCGFDYAPSGMSLLGTSSGGNLASYMVPTIPEALIPHPCILSSQPGNSDAYIREQVLEGLALAEPAQAAVEAYFADNGEAPVDRSAAGMSAFATDTVGNYVRSVDVEDGTVTITFGGYANAIIYYETLSLTPYESPDLSITWRCGYSGR